MVFGIARVRCLPQPLVAGEQERLGLGVLLLAEQALAQEALDEDGRAAPRETTGPLSHQSLKALAQVPLGLGVLLLLEQASPEQMQRGGDDRVVVFMDLPRGRQRLGEERGRLGVPAL